MTAPTIIARAAAGRAAAAILAALCAVLVAGCVGVPDGVEAVRGFDAKRYTGRWYSIARLDHSFERGLVNVSAEYALRADGRLDVTNRGFDPAQQRWREIKGVAGFLQQPDVAMLYVQFFWPFRGGYNVIELDPDYRWAMVAGPNRGYLWILARDPRLDRAIVDRLLARATALGFDTGKVAFIDQTPR